MPSVFAWKVLGTLKLYNNYSYYNPEIVQAACKKFEADISELKNRLKTQETETRKANAKFETSVAAQEKLKKKFETERKTCAEEKAALVSRAEQAEAALTERTAELSGLKRHVSQMVAAIFGKSFRRLSTSLQSLCLITPIIASGLSYFAKQVPEAPTSIRTC